MVIREELAPADTQVQTVLECRHYWIIEPAKGPVSQGECQNCGESREFQNSIIEGERDY